MPVTDHIILCEHFRDPPGEGVREALHVRLAQGCGPVVLRGGGAKDFGAEPHVAASPVGRRWGTPEDGRIGVGEEPLDCPPKGLDQAGFHVVWARGLAVGLIQRGLADPHGVLLDLGPRPLRNLGHVATEVGQVHWAVAVQLFPEGADLRHHDVGLRQELLGVGNPQVPWAQQARGVNLDGPWTAFHVSTMSWALRRQKSLMARLPSAATRVQRWRMSSPRTVACCSSSSCSWSSVVGPTCGDTSRSTSASRSAASEWMPCWAAFAWYTSSALADQA